MRFKLILEYDGTNYHGWQVQPNGRTIQAVLEEALARMLGESPRVAAAGRTDAGVHASGQVVSFDLQRPREAHILQRGLNALTPPDMSVLSVEVVDDGFDPRRNARSRAYQYRIWNAPQPSPFWRLYAWHVAVPLDLAAMQVAAQDLLGEHDFSTFRAAGCDAEHAVRRVFLSELVEDGPLVTYRIEATAFLRHMVRNVVGTLVEVGRGCRGPTDISGLLEARDRTLAGATAPARGLCLTQVNY